MGRVRSGSQAAGLEPLAAQTHALRRMLEQLQWQASKIL
jgi:hypothetical protein